MKILVTGANGYIGMGVVDCLINDGVDVVATDFSNSNLPNSVKFIKGNLFEIDDPFKYFDEPDAVLHLAWRDGFKHDSDTHLNDLNYHYLFLKKMMDSGIRQVTVMGSVHEIGFYEGSVDELTPTNPQSLYGISKNALRNAVEIYVSGKNIVFQWLRGFYIVGNSEYGCSVFSKITQAVKEGKDVFPFTMGKNQFDFIDYNLFCDQIAKTVEQNRINGIINCCSGNPMPIGDRVQQFIDDNNYNIKLQFGAFPDRPYDSKAIWGSNKKISSIMDSV